MDIGALKPADRRVEGVVEMMLDATRHHDRPLTAERLFAWHASLFLMMVLDLRLEVDQIREHVASVVYDHRDQSVRTTFIRPPEPEDDPDCKEVELPLGKRKRRKA